MAATVGAGFWAPIQARVKTWYQSKKTNTFEKGTGKKPKSINRQRSKAQRSKAKFRNSRDSQRLTGKHWNKNTQWNSTS